jgi:hypothetical protein
MTFTTGLMLLTWVGAGFMAAGAFMVMLAVVIAVIAGSFGWVVDLFE